jgi:hypothetical protein
LKKIISVFAIALFIVSVSIAQSIGVRAGWNFSKFSGPLEPSEQFKLSNGIHFGINYGYKLSNNFMVRAELLYTQVGSKQLFDSSSYYLVYTPQKTVFEKGRRTLDLQVSNSYVGLPITAAYQVGKFEFVGGLNPSVLISPTGRGTLRFESKDHPKEIIFRQALDHRYYGDIAKGTAQTSNAIVRIIVEGNVVNLPKTVGAYYQNDVVNDKLYNWFNLSAVGGVNYFVNRGLYIGARVERGLLDITSNTMDFSISELNPDLTQKPRVDKDLQLSYQVSLGFRF